MHPLEVCVLPIHVVHRDMQFTEIGFAIFFVAVFALYWFVLRRRTAAQNVLLLAASYLFYGWWDWRFLGLIMLTTATTYGSAFLARKPYGKAAVTANIALNLGILALFKYLGFFTENLQRLIAAFGWNIGWFTVDVLLPVGISFYTFQAIAYSVDVYKGRVEACRDPLAFATFIAYFPQLVAGPIERASSLLPQIERPRRWDYAQAVDGCRMVLFGIMKKVCVADMLAIYVDRLYADISSPAVCVAAGLLFTMEIYFDFLGLQRDSARHVEDVGHRTDGQFPLPVFLAQRSRVLAALAHFAHELVPRLPVHPARGQQERTAAHHIEHHDNIRPVGTMAWRGLEFHSVGHLLGGGVCRG